MGLETATYVSGLNENNPATTDFRSEGDNHLRLIKSTLLATFPDASKPFYFPKSLTVSSNTTLDPEDSGTIVRLNANGGSFNLTLPAGLGADDEGWIVYLVRTDDSANAVTIVGDVAGFTDPDLIGEGLPVIIGYTGTEFVILGAANLDLTYTVSASATTHIGRQPSTFVTITGNTNISSFGTGMAGQIRVIKFTGTPNLVHSSSTLVVPGGASIAMGNNHHAMVMCLGGEKWVVVYAADNNGSEP